MIDKDINRIIILMRYVVKLLGTLVLCYLQVNIMHFPEHHVKMVTDLVKESADIANF